MGVYSMITDIGLSEMASASDGSGMLIDIKYWVAAFDKRLSDDYDEGNSNATQISNYTTPEDTWVNFGRTKNTTYNVDEPLDTVFWDVDVADDWLQDVGISDVFRGVSYTHVANAPKIDDEGYRGQWDLGTETEFPQEADTGDFWEVSGNGIIDGIYMTNGEMLMYNGTALINITANGKYRGNFKAIVQHKTKSLYVNKVGLYAVKRTLDGTITSDQPFLLGQVIIPKTQLIQPGTSDNKFSVDQLIVDFQIDAQAAMLDFDNIVFASPNDYWSRVTNNDGQYGLQYDGSVFIANKLGFEDGSTGIRSPDINVAKTLISTFESVNKPDTSEEKDLPQLVLQYIKDRTSKGGDAFAPRIRSTLRTAPTGNLELDLYGSCDNEYGYYSFIPKTDRLFGLGNNDNRWKSIKTSDRLELYIGAKYDEDIKDIINFGKSTLIAGDNVALDEQIPYNPHTDTYNVVYSNQETSIGVITTESVAKGKPGKVKMRRGYRWDYISDGTGYIVFKKDDMNRDVDTGLGYFGNSSVEIGPHYDQRDIKDLDKDPYINAKDNNFYLRGNVSNYVAGVKNPTNNRPIYKSYPLHVRSTDSLLIYSFGEDFVSNKEKTRIGGSSWNATTAGVEREFEGLISQGTDKTSKEFVNKFIGYGGVPTIFDNMFGTLDDGKSSIGSSIRNMDDARVSLYGTINPNGTQNGGSSINKDIYLASSRYLYTFGDIVPMVDGLNNLGATEHGFNRLYVSEIVGQNYVGGTKIPAISMAGSIYPSDKNFVIGRDTRIDDDTVDGVRFKELNVDNLGNNLDYIDNSFVSKTYTNNIILDKNGTLSFNDIDSLIISKNQISGYIHKIGSEGNRVGTLYVDNLVLTNRSMEKSVSASVPVTEMEKRNDTYFKDWLDRYKFSGAMNYNSLTGALTVTVSLDMPGDNLFVTEKEIRANSELPLSINIATLFPYLGITDYGAVTYSSAKAGSVKVFMHWYKTKPWSGDCKSTGWGNSGDVTISHRLSYDTTNQRINITMNPGDQNCYGYTLEGNGFKQIVSPTITFTVADVVMSL